MPRACLDALRIAGIARATRTLEDRAHEHLVTVLVHQTGRNITSRGATFAVRLARGASAHIVRAGRHDSGYDEGGSSCCNADQEQLDTLHEKL